MASSSNQKKSKSSISYPPNSVTDVGAKLPYQPLTLFEPPSLVKKPEVTNINVPDGEKPVDKLPSFTQSQFAELMQFVNENKNYFAKNAQTQQKSYQDNLDDKARQEAESVVQPITFRSQAAFWVLPRLGGVVYPFSNPPGAVPVASSHWMHCLDKLRASGWSSAYIDKWLADSAAVVLRDANFDVIENGINKMEDFAMWWPDPERHMIKITQNWKKLIDDVRKAGSFSNSGLRYNPFSPRNNKDVVNNGAYPVGPPLQLDFEVNGKKYHDFLRNWTRVESKGFGEYEMRPPIGQERSWIPIEYHEEIEEAYDLIPFYYIEPKAFASYMATLAIPDGKSQNIDDQGHTHLDMKTSQGAVTLSIGEITLNLNIQNENENWISLRKWLIVEKFTPLEHGRLIYFILNAPAYPGDTSYTYSDLGHGRTRVSRMYADAPASFFAKQLVEKYAKRELGDDFDTLRQNFIINSYNVISNINGPWEKLPEEMTLTYANYLGKVFDLAMNRDEFNKMGATRQVTSTGNIGAAPPSNITKAKLNSMSLNSKVKLLDQLILQVKNA